MKNDEERKHDISETQMISKLTDYNEEPSEKESDADEDKMSQTQMFAALTDDQTEKLSLNEIHTYDKNDPDKEEKKESAAHEVLAFFRDLIIIILAVFAFTNFIARPVNVKGSSMYPTLQDGALGFSNVIGYSMDSVKRFDIVIIYIEDKNEYIVKRVIGMPGETVSYTDGQLYINGKAMEESFFDESYVSSFGNSFMEDVAPITLGDDEYYCLGDNRPYSQDSRYYGPFSKDQIRSKGVWIFWPFSDFGVKNW